MATILVVDDHTVSREITARLLRSNGYDVLRAANGSDALDLLDQCDADLALVDVLMPEMDGLTLLEKLQDTPKWQNLPVILVSGVADDETVGRGQQLGARDYLVKARHSPDDLLTTIQAQLQPANVPVA